MAWLASAGKARGGRMASHATTSNAACACQARQQCPAYCDRLSPVPHAAILPGWQRISFASSRPQAQQHQLPWRPRISGPASITHEKDPLRHPQLRHRQESPHLAGRPRPRLRLPRLQEAGPGPRHRRRWLDQLDWEVLVNRKGTTWRNLPTSARRRGRQGQRAGTDAGNPSVIKRPVLEGAGPLAVGFSPDAYGACSGPA
jgi:arsenate reductase-like glutaredoxin family protein